MTKRNSRAVIVLCLVVCAVVLADTGCARKSVSAAGPPPTAFGSAMVESSGGKQIGAAEGLFRSRWSCK